ncbi:MAG TPA: M1 family metallopeptidase [Cyclobacteriaceae bacterium]
MKQVKEIIQYFILIGLFSIFFGCKDNVPIASPDIVNDVPQKEIEKKYQPTPARIFDILHTKLKISFDWVDKEVIGEAYLLIKPYSYPAQVIELDARDFQIENIKDRTGKNLKYSYDGNTISIDLERNMVPQEETEIHIKYIARPCKNELVTQPDYQNLGLYFINHTDTLNKPQQIWTHGEPYNNSAWFPTIDQPNEKFTQEIYITVDSTFKTLSNGQLIHSKYNDDKTRTDYWRLDQPHAAYLPSIVVGEFHKIEKKWNNTPINTWVENHHIETAKAVFKNTPEMMNFFSEKLNVDYPFPAYNQVIVRDFVTGAMENTGASIFQQELVSSKNVTFDINWDFIIAHELFHQWFGNLVTCESWSHIVLNEALANYSEYLWTAYKYGLAEAKYHHWQEMNSYFDEALESKHSLVRNHYDDPSELFDNHTYAKGGRVIHMLRNYLGDSIFFNGLNIYLNENKFQSVETDHLRLAMEKASGVDLNWFFDQWFFRAGHPILNIEHTLKGDTLTINIKQDTKQPYRLITYLEIYYDEGIESLPLLIDDHNEDITLILEEEPKLVTIDASNELLAEISHKKSIKEYIYQFINLPHFASTIESFEILIDTLERSDRIDLYQEMLMKDNDRLKIKGLQFLYSDSVFSNNLKLTVRNLAKHNKSQVRVEAMALLFSWGNDTELLKLALMDSSFMVRGIGLDRVIQQDDFKINRDSLFNRNSEFLNINLILPVAQYYIESNNWEKYDWFLYRMYNLPNSDLFYLLNYFNQYIFKAPLEIKLKASEHLFFIAKHHHDYPIRFSAFQGLNLISDTKGVGQKIKFLKDYEEELSISSFY